MSTIGNIIPTLSTSSLLTANSTWTSEGQQLGVWNCLSIMINTDVDGYLTVSWSAYGSVYDYSTTYNVYAGQEFYSAVTPISAWCKLSYKNSATNQALFRLYTYGTPTNNATTLVIPPGSNFNIRNLPLGGFNDILVSQDIPEVSYSFDYGSPSATRTFLNTAGWHLPYPDITGISSGSYDINIKNGVLNSALILASAPSDYLWSAIQGKLIRARRGQAMRCRFTAQYILAPLPKYGPNPSMLMVGMGYTTSAGVLTDGFYFGYSDPTSLQATGAFSVCMVNAGVKTSVLQTNWNIDRCDGTQVLPLMVWENLNNFQITTQGMGAGTTIFAIENPRTGVIYPVHAMFLTNTATYTPNPITKPSCYSLGLSMGGNYTVGSLPISQTDWFGITGMAIFREGPIGNIDTTFSHTTSGVTSSTSESAFVRYRNNTTWYGKDNRVPIKLRNVCAVSSSQGVLIRMFQYNTSTSAALADIDQYLTSLQVSSTITSTILDGILISSFIIGVSDVMVDLNKYDIILDPGDTLVLTTQSFFSSVNVAATLTFSNL